MIDEHYRNVLVVQPCANGNIFEYKYTLKIKLSFNLNVKCIKKSLKNAKK